MKFGGIQTFRLQQRLPWSFYLSNQGPQGLTYLLKCHLLNNKTIYLYYLYINIIYIYSVITAFLHSCHLVLPLALLYCHEHTYISGIIFSDYVSLLGHELYIKTNSRETFSTSFNVDSVVSKIASGRVWTINKCFLNKLIKKERRSPGNI